MATETQPAPLLKGRGPLAEWTGSSARLLCVRAAVVVACAAGSVLLAFDYSYAGLHFPPDGAIFDLFWLGFLVAFVPTALRLIAASVPRVERLCLVVILGLLHFLPKYLRNPAGPLFHDELNHWRQAEVVHELGVPFQPSPLAILEYFPGLHLLTDELRLLTGLSTFAVGTIVLAALHVLALIGVFLIAERFTSSARIGAVAALLYSVNPGFMFFDSQYSYESIAIVLYIWVMLAVFAIAHGDRRSAGGWLAAGVVLGLACVVTHHLSTYTLLIALGFVVAANRWWRRPGRAPRDRLIAALAAILVVGAAAWATLIATGSFAYIAPTVAQGFAELGKLIAGEQESRTLFEGSPSPLYERVAAFLAPVIAGVTAAAALWGLRRWRHRRPVAAGLALFGFLYFPSTLLILSATGNEGARRSWSFTYLGLSVLVAPALAHVLGRAGQRGPRRGVVAAGATVALVSVVLVGNVAAGLNETYRFPGPFVFGSDTRSLTTEVLTMADWLRQTQGRDNRVVSDRYTGLALRAFGRQEVAAPSYGFPTWELFNTVEPPDRSLLRKMRTAQYRFLIIDERASRLRPRIGIYFDPGEPQVRPLPEAALRRYRALPWTTRVFSSDNLAVYRLDWASLDRGPAPGVRP